MNCLTVVGEFAGSTAPGGRGQGVSLNINTDRGVLISINLLHSRDLLIHF